MNPAAAVAFSVSSIGKVTAGTPFAVTVTAHDAFGNTVTAFNGPVTLFSSDGQKVLLSGPLTLTHGVGTAQVTLDTANVVALTAVGSGIGGTSSAITITAASASSVKILAPTVVEAGVAFGVTVIVKDQFGNLVTGTVQVSGGNSEPHLPVVVKVVNGVGTVAVTLDHAGSTTLTATAGAAQGSSTVTVDPAGLASFAISAPSNVTAGTAFTVTITAQDAFGNTVTAFTGPAFLTSSDGQAVTPVSVALTGGVGSAQVTLAKAGTIQLTATLDGVKGVSGEIVVG